jgi:type IV pilus assembly PilO-like protein
MIANLSGRVAAALAAAVVLVAVLAGWFLFVSPERSKAADLSTKIDQTQVQVFSTQAYVNSPVTKRAVHDLKRLQGVLPDDPRMSQVLRQLSAIAKSAQVSLGGITPATPVPSGGGEAVPVALTVTGHYVNISQFLRDVRTDVRVKGTAIKGSGRLFSVDSIQFSAGGTSATGAGSSVISAAIALNAFVYSPASAATASSATTTTPTDTTAAGTTGS